MQSNQPKSQTGSLLLAGGLAVVAGLVRLIPHPFNMTPLGALGLFGGARLRGWSAYVLPLVVLFLTDCIIWLVLGWAPFNPFVYGSFLLNVVLGRVLLRESNQVWRIGSVTILGSLQFFLITNFGVWFGTAVDPGSIPDGSAFVKVEVPGQPYPDIHYARNLTGLGSCYVMAVLFAGTEAPPLGFFFNLLVGDLAFTGLLFGLHAVLARRWSQAQPVLVRELQGERV